MKQTLVILVCMLIGWMTASGAFAQGYNKNTHQAQQQLSELGYAPGPSDGIMGDKTRKAIKKFQKDHNMTVTGTLNDATMNKMKQVSNNTSSGKNSQQKQGSNVSGKQSGKQGNNQGCQKNNQKNNQNHNQKYNQKNDRNNNQKNQGYQGNQQSSKQWNNSQEHQNNQDQNQVPKN